jgi:copper chaperone NosL
MKRFTCVGWLVFMALSEGCAREPLDGPPDQRVGSDSCLECGMLIAEDRCAAAALVERRGRREHVHFDDVGCLLDAMRDGAELGIVVEVYVHDYDSKEWVRAEEAVYVVGESSALKTPMGSGIVAFGNESGAEGAASRAGGSVTDFAGVSVSRDAWRAARRGPGPLSR